MWPQCLIISSIALAVIAIKVPVDNPEAEATDIIPVEAVDDNVNKPVYYLPNDGNSDSFLIPPHQLEEIEVSAPINKPATYLLPPAPGKHIDYYLTSQPEEPEQTDWYPIASDNKKQAETTQIQTDDASKSETENYRNGKVLKENQINSLPSRSLVPPTANAQNDYIILAPSLNLELPHENIDKPMALQEIPKEVYSKIRPHTVHPKVSLVPYLMPPRILPPKHNPTKLYPKKFVKEFKPIPIPINQYADESIDKVPMARPAKPFRPIVNGDGQYDLPRDKQVYLYEKAENQRKLQSETEGIEQPQALDCQNSYVHVVNPIKDVPPREQEASESNFGHPGRNVYSAPLKQAPLSPPTKYGSGNGERTEFRMHGMKGPHSYQFGFDTGKGKNRQFRYEERDNDGHVKGHYGYVDKHGKMRVVNYDADPEHGFRAESPVEKE